MWRGGPIATPSPFPLGRPGRARAGGCVAGYAPPHARTQVDTRRIARTQRTHELARRWVRIARTQRMPLGMTCGEAGTGHCANATAHNRTEAHAPLSSSPLTPCVRRWGPQPPVAMGSTAPAVVTGTARCPPHFTDATPFHLCNAISFTPAMVAELVAGYPNGFNVAMAGTLPAIVPVMQTIEELESLLASTAVAFWTGPDASMRQSLLVQRAAWRAKLGALYAARAAASEAAYQAGRAARRAR